MKSDLALAFALGLQLLPISSVAAAPFDAINSTNTNATNSTLARPFFKATRVKLAHPTWGIFRNFTSGNFTLASRPVRPTASRPVTTTTPVASDGPVVTSVPGGQVNPADSGAMAIYNLGNVVCNGTAMMDHKLVWDLSEGDRVYGEYQKMLAANALLCDDCFGMSKAMCKSTKPECAKGLADLATDDQGRVRWDRGLARFSRNAALRDLVCEVNTGDTCSAPPSCEDTQGPGAWVLLKSITTIHSFFDTVYNAIGEARNRLATHMDLFASTFAPLPDIHEDSLMLTILTAIGCGLLGFIPGAGGVLAGMGGGVGTGVVMENFFMHQPRPANPGEYLQAFTDATQAAFKDIADGLLRDGQYTFRRTDGSNGETMTLRERLADGVSLDQSSNTTDFFADLVPNFERIVLQQLVLFTWQHMQSGHDGHLPFIAFDQVPCDQVNHDDPNSLAKKTKMGQVKDLDAAYTYEGKCYYLLDGMVKFEPKVYEASNVCYGNHALPGGKNKALTDRKDSFADLSLADFVEPAVKAWFQAGWTNDYKPASDAGNLVASPRDPAAVRIPVCDYLKFPDAPGVGCPRLGERTTTDACPVFERGTGTNRPGDYQPGYCKLHFKQHQKNEGNANPFDEFQLEVNVFDDADRLVGQAVKQRAGTAPIEIADTSLPFNLIAWTNRGDNDPVQFWYADQYWDTNNAPEQHNCKVGRWDGRSHTREGDCGFQCPRPDANNPAPPRSATVDHPLPAPARTAIPGDATFVNTFHPTTTTSTSTAPPQPTYSQGWCGTHVRQWQRNENGIGGDYQLEVIINDGAGKAVGQSGKVVVRPGAPHVVDGFVAPFRVSVGGRDEDPIGFAFTDQTWNSKDRQCKMGRYDSGHRDMDCGFRC